MSLLGLDLGKPKRQSIIRIAPPIPETNWRAPSEFPNLSSAVIIGIDTERKEYDFERGPGWSKGLAHTVGVSVAAKARDGTTGAWYFPIAHEVERHNNLDGDHVKAWLRYALSNPYQPKVGANLYYDLGSLTDDNIYPQGDLYDVQFAEALLSSDGEVNLDYLGFKYLEKGKEINELYAWLNLAYGKPRRDQRENIWRSPPSLAGPYAEADALMPLQILEKQLPLLQSENLMDVFRLECRLIRLMVEMRILGVTIDIEATEKLYNSLAVDVTNGYQKIKDETGIALDSVNSGKELGKLFDQVGIQYPRTADGNPSFRKDWLKGQADEHPIAALVNEVRELEKVRGTFLRNYILKGHVNGKIHCCFNQLRSDRDGTITGRFSSTDPNLQNIPVRSDLGKKLRKLFIPDSGHIQNRKYDYSQIEYRYLSHWAVDKGDGSAEKLRQSYRDNPKTDYHDRTFGELAPLMGWDLSDAKQAKELRKPVKNINFGLLYGMGKPKLKRSIAGYFGGHWSDKEADEFFANYHKAAPYVKPTMQQAADEIAIHGYITTVLGRRTRFNLWCPIDRDDYGTPYPYEKALRFYGQNIKRAHAHKAINYRLQGSAADQIKQGMVDCYEAGVFKMTGVPRLQVHDELVFSDYGAPPEAWAEMQHILETCIPLRVPVIADGGAGPNWGDCEK